jgi:site-specific DNA-methyltransferase (adenine-specific)
MNLRKLAYINGFEQIKRTARAKVARDASTVGSITPALYNPRGMPETNQIVQGDCIKVLNDGPEAWVDLVFADPPFNIGYLYHGYNDQRKTEDYLKFSHDWMQAVHRALKPSGSFYLAIGDEYAADLAVIARRQIGFHLRNWIVWHYTFGQQMKQKFAKSHTHILYFTKAKDPGDFTFNADAVRVASARQTTYADVRANPKGKVPDDTWYLRPQETSQEFFAPDADTWYVSRVCGTFKEREGWHGCQMPIAVLDRIIKASSNPGDVVLDPFNGSGTTAVSAALLDRKYVGIDQSKEYVDFARKRLQHALEATRKKGKHAAIADPNRDSRILTPTDAFGRKRVPRKKAGRSMNGKTMLTKTA